MAHSSAYYLKLYLDHLYEIEMGIIEDDLSSCSSLCEHHHAFLMTLGVDDENAWDLINDFMKRPASTYVKENDLQ